MANPSWSIDNISFTTLPGSYRYGGKPRTIRIEDIHLRSDAGGEFNYQKFSERNYLLNWLITDTECDVHENMFIVIGGRSNPFYFSISGAGVGDSVFVRLDSNIFDPEEKDSPVKPDGQPSQSLYGYTLAFHTEIP